MQHGYLNLMAAGGKLKGKQSQSKPFSTKESKDMVDNRRLKPTLVCCLFPDQIFCELSAFPASPDGRARVRLPRSSRSWMIVFCNGKLCNSSGSHADDYFISYFPPLATPSLELD